MWLIAKPLSKNEELGFLTSCIEVENEMPRLDITSLGCKIVKEIIHKAAPATISQISENAEAVAVEWFLFILNKIICISNSNPVYLKDPSQKKKGVKGEDITWAINHLPKKAFLQALSCCFWKIYRSKGKNNPTHQHFPNFLAKFGDDKVRKSEDYWESSRRDNRMNFKITCEGKVVLLNWMSEILSRAMNMAGKERIKHGLKRITGLDMLWGLNWARLKLLLGTPFSFHGQENKNKKRKRTRNQTASDHNYDSYLPHDLLESHIYPNLPLKSLLRFNCVCKEWRQTISSSYLRCSQQTQQGRTTISIAVFNSGHRTIYKDIESECEGLEVVMFHTISYKGMPIYLYGSCSGLLCFAIPTGRMKWRFTIGNPVTREWHLLPPSIYPISTSSYFCRGPGLAVDTSTNPPSYKLVVPSFGNQLPLFQVFSSETWQWKALNVKTDPKIDISGKIQKCEHYSLYIDGVLYYSTSYSGKYKLVWLDLGNEMMGTIPLPGSTISQRSALGSLEKLDGRRRLTCSVNVDGKTVKTYVLDNNNEWEIWLSVNVNCGKYFEPYPYYGGEIIVVNEFVDIYAYHLKTKEWRSIGIDKDQRTTGYNSFPYKMSLLPLPKSENLFGGGEKNCEEKEMKRKLGQDSQVLIGCFHFILFLKC